jgi:NAD(P)H-quinone oxidoreductase subunit 5
LHDYHLLENAIGDHLPQQVGIWERLLPENTRSWIYSFALERGYLDGLLTNFLGSPFVWLFQRFDALERRWTDFLSGGQSRESDRVKHSPESLEELL